MDTEKIALVGITYREFKQNEFLPIDFEHNYPLSNIGDITTSFSKFIESIKVVDFSGNEVPYEKAQSFLAPRDGWGLAFSFVPNGIYKSDGEFIFNVLQWDCINIGEEDVFEPFQEILIQLGKMNLEELNKNLSWGEEKAKEVSFLTKWKINFSRDYWTGETDYDYDLLGVIEIKE